MRVSPWIVGVALLGSSACTKHEVPPRFRAVETQFIAALADPSAASGTGAQSWGVWHLDPGPRGVKLGAYERLKSAGGVAPAQWKFDSSDWWLEEHGLIMEKPVFPLPPGKYVVTGDREVTTVLTVHPKDKDGTARWELANGATIYDVTHLACRSARYTPAASDRADCSPDKVARSEFPVAPGATMPSIEGCRKQDYAVLFLIGVAEDG
jgi:hypothetical protein